MVSKSESNTPSISVPDHPANSLSYGNEDQISTLLKLQPIYMPTDKHTNEETLDKVRSSYKYLYVVNWLYQCRGYIKLQSEYFDVDLFEIELLNMVYPPPVDDSILFINKLKLALISTVQNSKCSSINNFEKIFRLWFGLETPLAGNEDEEDETPEPKFDNLLIEDKFGILFTLISYITQYQSFRNYLDKNNVSPDLIKVTPVYSEEVKKDATEDHILLFENTKLYKRTIKFPELSIPKKRKLAPEIPEEFFEPEQFDIESPSFEIISKNIYELNSFLLDIYGKRKVKKFKILYSNLANDEVFESIFNAEIRKRKILTNRRKELQLANLLATRKRSSRLEAKEKQRQEELRLLKLQEEEELKIAGEKRLERRRMMKDQGFNSFVAPPGSNTLSREERLKLRKLTSESNQTTASPEIESQTGNIIKLEDTLLDHSGANIDHSKELDSFVTDNTLTNTVNEKSTIAADSIGVRNDQANMSIPMHISNSLPEQLVQHVHYNVVQAPSHPGHVDELQEYSNSPSPTIQRSRHEIQRDDNITTQSDYGTLPRQPVQSHNAHMQPIQQPDNLPTQAIQGVSAIPSQTNQYFADIPTQHTHDINTNFMQPNQSIQKISSYTNQLVQGNNPMPNADSIPNHDRVQQTHESSNTNNNS